MRAAFGIGGLLRGVCLGLGCALLAAAAPDTIAEDVAAGEWPLPAHGYDGNRYVKTTALGPANVGRLRTAWSFAVADDAMMETAPIVRDGVVYVTSGHDGVYALDAASGALKWSFAYKPARVIAMAANRGVAVAGGKVFLGTLDGRVIALDARTGRMLWNVLGVHDASDSFYTMAPIVYRNTVIIGVSNGDWGGVGYVSGFDVRSGRRVWEWTTIPGPREAGHETWAGESWRRGGGAVWGGLTLDPVGAILFIDVGNPQPDFVGADRAGSNLYTDSMVALDISSRRPRVRWYHQFVAHDTHDWDPAMPPVRFMGSVRGEPRELIAAGDKGGDFWVLDALSGELVEHAVVSAQRGHDSEPSAAGTLACPGTNGGVQYNGGSYLPETNTFYVPSVDQCGVYQAKPDPAYTPGNLNLGGEMTISGRSSGWMNAIDIGSGRMRWRVPLALPGLGGALALSSGLVFSGQLDGQLDAFDAATGKIVWHAPTGAPIKAPATLYAIAGKPYVIVASGPAGRNWELPGVPTPTGAARITVFTLP